MKLLFISPYNTSGGAERVMTTLVNELSYEHDVTFVTFDSQSSFYPINERVKQVRMGLISNSNSILKILSIGILELRRYRMLLEIIKENKPDCVISFLFMPSILSILACKKTNVPIIISERNDPEKYSYLKRIIMKSHYKHADGIVCQSSKIQSMADKDYRIRHSCVIPNPLNHSQYLNSFISEKHSKIISVGRLIEQKNHFMTIDAFNKISKKYPEYQLIIYGEGPLRKDLENRIKELGLSGRVFLPGITNEVMKNNADAMLFVMSSNYEGFPNVLVEAMANGVLSISTDFASGAAKDIIKEGQNGFLIPIKAVDALAEIMDEIFSNPHKFLTMAEYGRDIIKDLDINFIKNKWMGFIFNVLNSSR